MCNKKKYKWQWQAAHKISEIAAKQQENKKPIRSYFCNQCGNYHLTSQDPNNFYTDTRKENEKTRINKLASKWEETFNTY